MQSLIARVRLAGTYADECAGNAPARGERVVARAAIHLGGRRGAPATNCCHAATACMRYQQRAHRSWRRSDGEVRFSASLRGGASCSVWRHGFACARRLCSSCWALPTSCRAASTCTVCRSADPQHEFVGKLFVRNDLRIIAPCCSVGTSRAMPSARERVFGLLGPLTKTEVWHTWPERSFRPRRRMF